MQVSNIHIENSANDGLSVIGGEPKLKNLIISNANGNYFDVSGGWSGFAENVIIDMENFGGASSHGVNFEGIYEVLQTLDLILIVCQMVLNLS